MIDCRHPSFTDVIGFAYVFTILLLYVFSSLANCVVVG